MSIQQLTFITITCDTCRKTVTFEATEESQKEAVHDNPWLNTHRAIQTWDARKFGYCSDECEAKAIVTGVHNKLEKRIVEASSQAQVDLAAKAAQQAAQANAALHQGSPVTLA